MFYGSMVLTQKTSYSDSKSRKTNHRTTARARTRIEPEQNQSLEPTQVHKNWILMETQAELGSKS